MTSFIQQQISSWIAQKKQSGGKLWSHDLIIKESDNIINSYSFICKYIWNRNANNPENIEWLATEGRLLFLAGDFLDNWEVQGREHRENHSRQK